ncbi:MAG: sterol desaturase family protein [Pseudomonadota bacterium]
MTAINPTTNTVKHLESDPLARANKSLPTHVELGRWIEKWIGLPFNAIEFIGLYCVTRPSQQLLASLDALSHKIEGTLFKDIFSRVLFPATLIITMVIGLALARDGVSLQSVSALSLVLIIYGLIFAPLERLFPYSRKWLHGENDLSVDIMMFFSGIVWGVLSKFLLSLLFITSLIAWLEPYGHQIWPVSLPAAIQVLLFVLLKDFFRYWYHRALHEIPFLWRWHAVHHSAHRLYWLNGVRAHPMEILIQTLVYAIPLALLQPPAEVALVAVFMALSIGIFQHANIDAKLGFWEYIFSIGDNHRYHHYPNKEVGDSNYGGEFIVWDIVFGTFHKPKGKRPIDAIGLGGSPDYPQTMAGLMIAPFIADQSLFSRKENSVTVAANVNESSTI